MATVFRNEPKQLRNDYCEERLTEWLTPFCGLKGFVADIEGKQEPVTDAASAEGQTKERRARGAAGREKRSGEVSNTSQRLVTR
jgi:hypothetical protein